MTRDETKRAATILGIADGLTIVIGLLIGLHHQSGAIFHASLSAGIAELVGMGAALWLASRRNVANFLAACACGIATALGCILPAVPYLFLSPAAALPVAAGIAIAIGAVVCWLRTEKGWIAIAETYGVLLLAALLCYGASLI
jgi:VIT1/CCC1 family predicted Fe2+/Mn2+ transporter